jgi:hypothetical protein
MRLKRLELRLRSSNAELNIKSFKGMIDISGTRRDCRGSERSSLSLSKLWAKSPYFFALGYV